MKEILFVTCCIFCFSGCGDYDYNVTEFPSNKLRFDDLPIEIKDFLKDPSDYKKFTPNGNYIGVESMICLNGEEYEFQTINSIVGSWVSYYKLINSKNNKSYRINYGNPFPYIMLDNELYLSNTYSVFIGDLDTSKIEFTRYSL